MTITESDLVLPALVAMLANEATGLSTAELQPILREELRPKGEDLLLLAGRGDDRFSQKVRNLRSHNRFERDGLADFDGNRYHITEEGKTFVLTFQGVDESFREQGFNEKSKQSALRPTRPLVFVEEGTTKNVSIAVRRRSRRLRQYAIGFFQDGDGCITCVGCGFEGTSVYGPSGKGLIEIHHTEPISLSGATVKPLADAVRKLAPLCPTCHRLVHREAGIFLSIAELQALVQDHAQT